MTRDVEVRVAAHRIARERREQGRPIWDRTIDIKPILAADQANRSEEHAVWVANEIAALVRRRVPAGWLDATSGAYDYELDEIVEDLESFRVGRFEDEDPAVDQLNGRLSELYDWADGVRVFLGTMPKPTAQSEEQAGFKP